MFAVKLRQPPNRGWWFYAHGRDFGVSRLRIHASQYRTREAARQAADELKVKNPDCDVKVVTLFKQS